MLPRYSRGQEQEERQLEYIDKLKELQSSEEYKNASHLERGKAVEILYRTHLAPAAMQGKIGFMKYEYEDHSENNDYNMDLLREIYRDYTQFRTAAKDLGLTINDLLDMDPITYLTMKDHLIDLQKTINKTSDAMSRELENNA